MDAASSRWIEGSCLSLVSFNRLGWRVAPRDLDPEYATSLIEIVRSKMNNQNLVVEVHCLRELWQEKAE